MQSRRTLLTLGLAVGGCAATAAVPAGAELLGSATADLPAQRAAMARLAAMAGAWRGPAHFETGEHRSLYFSKRVERDMDGLLLIIRSNGYADSDRSDSPITTSLTIVSFDDTSRRYQVRSYANGRADTMEAHLLDTHLQWRRPDGQITERLTIAIQDDQWRETSDVSSDGGATWTRAATMRLVRVARNAP